MPDGFQQSYCAVELCVEFGAVVAEALALMEPLAFSIAVHTADAPVASVRFTRLVDVPPPRVNAPPTEVATVGTALRKPWVTRSLAPAPSY